MARICASASKPSSKPPDREASDYDRASFGLHSVVLEYVTEQMIEDVAQELVRCEMDLVLRQPLVKATAKEYVRRSQERLIGAPLVERLVELRGRHWAAEQRLISLLDKQRGRPLD